MKITQILFVFSFILFINQKNCTAQFYKENSGEIIFAFSNVEKAGEKVNTKLRFSCFFHAGQNYHFDISKNFGVFSGYGIRNIGIITEENDLVLKKRTYALGIPLAVKIGSFRNKWYAYWGGEYEMFFHYKQKQISSGNKKKQSEWFSDRTERFVPSLFGGIQFPGGVNLKLKYYPENFLNNSFKGVDFGNPVDYSEYNKTQLIYFALTFNFKSGDLKKYYKQSTEPDRIANL
jgi:hypothetical protein